MLDRFCLVVALVLGLGLLANGIIMLMVPEPWYFTIPGVTDTGPFNQHFLRDIGLIFLLLGAAVLIGLARPQQRPLLWGMTALWLSGHALFHLWEVAAGICSPSAIPRDFPAVTLPALIAIALTFWALRRGNARAADAFA